MTAIISSLGAVARFLRRNLLLAACGMLATNALAAQPGGVPAACAGKTGAELDTCMRGITPPQFSQGVRPVQQQPSSRPSPSLMVNCEKVLPADKSFCVWRNQAIIDCRQRMSKQPDFRKCFDPALERGPKPGPADCSKVKSKALAAQCPARNKHYKTCGADPFNYFTCLDKTYAQK